MKIFSLLLAVLASSAASSAQAEDARCDAQTYLDVGHFSKNGSACSAATGFSFLPTYLIAPPTAKQLDIMCTNAPCLSMIADLNEAFPTECMVTFDTGIRETLLDPVAVACATVTTPPFPSPTTATPAPTASAPVPTTRPVPIPTATAPASTTSTPPVLNGPCGNEQVGAQVCPESQYCQPWNPTHYQCRSIDAKCGVLEVDVDYYGDDLASFQLTLPEECCSKCAATTGCKAYTFVNYNADGKANCYLKKGTGQKSNKVGAISATIVQEASCGAKAPAKCSRQYINVDFYGNDIATFNSVSNDECCERCAGMTGCKAYTYVAGNAASASACYLKSDASDQRTSLGLLSGLVN